MRALLLCFVFLGVLASPCGLLAQSTWMPHHPSDSGATQIGTIQGVADLGDTTFGDWGDLYPGGLASSECRTQFEICVWRLTNGRIDYVVRASSVQFGMGCDANLDSMTTASIFHMIAYASVRSGLGAGYGTCAPSCTVPDTVRVWQNSCVLRSGSGATTGFVPCDSTAFCERTFAVCCPGGTGTPNISYVAPSATTTCSLAGGSIAGCTITCP